MPCIVHCCTKASATMNHMEVRVINIATNAADAKAKNPVAAKDMKRVADNFSTVTCCNKGCVPRIPYSDMCKILQLDSERPKAPSFLMTDKIMTDSDRSVAKPQRPQDCRHSRYERRGRRCGRLSLVRIYRGAAKVGQRGRTRKLRPLSRSSSRQSRHTELQGRRIKRQNHRYFKKEDLFRYIVDGNKYNDAQSPVRGPVDMGGHCERM